MKHWIAGMANLGMANFKHSVQVWYAYGDDKTAKNKSGIGDFYNYFHPQLF